MGLTVKNLMCHVRVTLPAEVVESGRPLDLATLSKAEALIGSRFDDVRIHTDASAGALARRLDADAVISGRDIYFGPGRFDVVTGRGFGLIAHELVHRRQETDGTDDADAEREAMSAEREAAAPGSSQDVVYLENAAPAEEADAATGDDHEDTTKVEAAKPPRAQPLPPADLEQLITAKVVSLMRSDIITEQERRGLLNGSGGRIPL